MTIQALPYNVFVLVSFSVLFWIKAIISGYSYKYKGSNYKKGNDGKEQNVYQIMYAGQNQKCLTVTMKTETL